MVTATFPETRLANVAAAIGDGTHGSYDRTPTGVPLLSAKNVLDGKLVLSDGESRVSEQDASEIERACRVRAGDVLVTTVGTLGRVAVFEPAERVLFQRSVAYVRPTSALDRRYLHWVLRGPRAQSEIALRARQSAQAGIYLGDLADLPIPVPSLEEQRRIADFLDDQVSRIDAATKARRSQAACVEEQASIALTEVLWGDDALVPLKYLTREIVVGIVVQPASWYTEESDGVPTVRGVDISPGVIDLSDLVTISPEGHRLHPRSALRKGDVLVVRTGSAGAASLVPDALIGGNTISNVIVRSGPGLDPVYLEQVLNSWPAVRQIEQESVGAIQQHFGVGAMKELRVPGITTGEQRSRAAAAATLRTQADQLAEAMRSSTALLAELKRSLISAAVSGEFDLATATGRGVPA